MLGVKYPSLRSKPASPQRAIPKIRRSNRKRTGDLMRTQEAENTKPSPLKASSTS
jgi:hypothetical protein